MKITRLRLLGFKSFVEPTEILIEPGLTGVVGPNGCGKSNLLEALRWAMGETSYKSMRGSAMEDVIFAGSQHRPSRNSAEVTLFIDNSARTAPAEFNDADDARGDDGGSSARRARPIGSTARMRGRATCGCCSRTRRPARARRRWCARAASARSSIPPRRSAAACWKMPRALPACIAAGTRPSFASRRRKPISRASADLIGQLASQLQALRRQARQAQRYREISGKIRETEALQHHLHWVGACAHVEQEEAAFQAALGMVAQETKAEGEALRQQAEAAEKLQPLRDEEAARAAVLHRLSVERDALEREEARAKARQAELETRLAQASRDLAREEEHIAEAEGQLAPARRRGAASGGSRLARP